MLCPLKQDEFSSKLKKQEGIFSDFVSRMTYVSTVSWQHKIRSFYYLIK